MHIQKGAWTENIRFICRVLLKMMLLYYIYFQVVLQLGNRLMEMCLLNECVINAVYYVQNKRNVVHKIFLHKDCI